jgi:hypothetical protein
MGRAADVAAPLLADRLRTQAVIAYSQVRRRARQTILDSYPCVYRKLDSARREAETR